MTLTYAPPGWAPWGGDEVTCACGNEFVPDGDQEECDECEELANEDDVEYRSLGHADGLRKQMREEPE